MKIRNLMILVSLVISAACGRPEDRSELADSKKSECSAKSMSHCLVKLAWEIPPTADEIKRQSKLPKEDEVTKKVGSKQTKMGLVEVYSEALALVAYLKTSKEVIQLGAIGTGFDLEGIEIGTTNLGYAPAVTIHNRAGNYGGIKWYFAIPLKGPAYSVLVNAEDSVEADLDQDGRKEMIQLSSFAGYAEINRLIPNKGFATAMAHDLVAKALGIYSNEATSRIEGKLLTFEVHKTKKKYKFKLTAEGLLSVP